MNKRISQANVYVKNEMYEALLKLLEEKTFSAISVSDRTFGCRRRAVQNRGY